jgi:hypothetical protein
MYNLERNLAYLTYADDPESPRKLGSDALESARANIIKAQLYFLLETQWVKPVPIGVTSGGRVGRRTVDIVQTLVDGKRVDFYLDRESHLPLKVAFINERDGRSYYWIMFSDYAPVNGIQMPAAN